MEVGATIISLSEATAQNIVDFGNVLVSGTDDASYIGSFYSSYLLDNAQFVSAYDHLFTQWQNLGCVVPGGENWSQFTALLPTAAAV